MITNQEVAMNAKIELLYPLKKTTADILSIKPSGILKEISSYGNLRLEGWKNMLVFGENLNVLSMLCHSPLIKGKVNLIYIDPPFSTNQVYRGGKDRTSTVSKSNSAITAYTDLLSGYEYLEFMRERLILLREILASDGSIFVHIDYKIGHYVKIIMDEIFGQDRFINDIARIKCNPKNFNRKAYGNIKDMVLIYSKTDKYIWNDPREPLTESDIIRLFPKIDDNGRRYTTTPLHAPGETQNGPTGQLWRGIKPPEGRHWRCKPGELEKLEQMGMIEWSPTGNPRKKIFASEVITRGKKRQDIWEFKDHPYPSYPTEKNMDMLKMIIETSSDINDLVLDCFTGSGSTLVAAEETGRRWIGIDNSEVAISIIKERMKSIDGLSAYSFYEIIKE